MCSISFAQNDLSISTATSSTATTPGQPGIAVYAADNDTTSRDKAVTPAGLAASGATGVVSLIKTQACSNSGTWSITGLTISKPVYLIFYGSAYNTYYSIVVTSGASTAGLPRFSFGSNGSSAYSGNSCILVPTSSTINITHNALQGGSGTIYVYQ